MNKYLYILKELSRKKGEKDLYEILEKSEFKFSNHWNQKSFPNLFDLEILTSPDLYTEYYDKKSRFEETLLKRINDSTPIMIDTLEIKPDYDRIQIINSQIESIQTPWHEINEYQKKLLDTLTMAKQSLDYQNVGLISRTIMEKLADLLFKPEIHNDLKMDLSKGKFKNQLHAFIQYQLKGKSNEELRKFAKNSVNFSRDAIDVIQKTTHNLDGQGYFAEICAISTINLVKTISEIK
jgi:hypothetical protein